MFSSDNDNSYPLSSYQLSPSSFTIPHESNNIFPQFPFLLNPPISETPILNHIMLSANSSLEPSISKAPTIKKDRHTKILTAQGVRDRRVRLSIDIAREFFSLQDMLGFDKASKTLGWLLSKSKDAINELANGETPNSSSPPASQIEDEQRNHGLSKNKGKEKREGNRDEESVEREMRRAKARERARERTDYKKKMVMNDYNNSSYGMLYNQQQQQQQLPRNESYLRGSCGDPDIADKQIYPRLEDQEVFNNHYHNDYLMRLELECNNGNIINQSTEIHLNSKQIWDYHGNQILN